LKDTARNIEAMKIDMVVMRHGAPGAALYLSKVIDAVVINAGDGAHEHPTQALLDIYSIREKHKSISGLKVCIVGDISHSRVALSNIHGFKTMGAEVAICGPSTLIPAEIGRLGIQIFNRIEDAIRWADVLNVLRIQLERQDRAYLPSLREYRQYFAVTKERLRQAGKEITILHPGPINRDVELSADVADGEHSLILQQVLNGVAVRMAVLYLLGTRV
jgi:Aspartate carbamoyltransferase, catalytic chain